MRRFIKRKLRDKVKNKEIMDKIYYCLVILLVTAGCKERYDSPIVSPTTGYLVVEGAINSGQGTTTLTLSRTTHLDNREIKYEKGAQVKVEGEDRTIYPLTETQIGQYSADNLNLKNTIKYRLSIKTSNGSTYLSDFVAAKNNPPIDSVNWVRDSKGVQFYINTHDPQNNTRYYQWEFIETWEFQSEFQTYIKYDIKTSPTGVKTYSAIFRDPTNPQFFDSTQYYCWQSFRSTNLLLGTTAKLNKDVINLPLAFIPQASIKLKLHYSINVKQYSLTPEAYAFLDIMKKNTEQTGSIFDAQPSGVYGNIHNVTDAEEPVIGYLVICPIQEKRIFIKNKEVPNWGYASNCKETTFRNTSNTIRDMGFGFAPTNVVPLSAPFPTITTFYAAPAECVDCRLSGTNIKPPFWP